MARRIASVRRAHDTVSVSDLFFQPLSRARRALPQSAVARRFFNSRDGPLMVSRRSVHTANDPVRNLPGIIVSNYGFCLSPPRPSTRLLSTPSLFLIAADLTRAYLNALLPTDRPPPSCHGVVFILFYFFFSFPSCSSLLPPTCPGGSAVNETRNIRGQKKQYIIVVL